MSSSRSKLDFSRMLRAVKADMMNLAHLAKSPSDSNDLKIHSGRVQQLLRVAQRFQTSSPVQPDVFDPIAEHLDVHLMPTPGRRTTSDVLAIDLAQRSISILRVCKYHLERNEPLMQKILSLWPAVWVWMQFFFRNVIEADVFHLDMGSFVLKNIVEFVIDFTRHAAIRSVIMGTRGALGFIAHFWIEEERFDPLNDMGSKIQRHDLLTHALVTLLLGHEGENYADELVYAANGRTSLARTVVRRLRDRLDSREEHAELQNIRFHISLILSLLDGQDDCALHDALLSAGAMRQVVRCLALVNAHGGSTHRDRADTAMACLVAIAGGLSRAGPHCRWLVQAIDAGLVPAVLDAERFAKDLPTDLTGELCARILRINLAPNLVNRRVVLALTRQHKWNPYARRLTDHHLQQTWSGVLGLAERHKIIKDIADEAIFRTCYHCERTVNQDHVTLKRCCRCRSVRYCSRRCQKLKWAKHKQDCRDHRKDTDVDEERLSSVSLPGMDKYYLYFLVAVGLEFRVEELNAILDAEHPSALLSDLVVIVDWTTVPPEIQVKRLDSCPDACQRPNPVRLRFRVRFYWDDAQERMDDTMKPPSGLRGAEMMLFWGYYFCDSD